MPVYYDKPEIFQNAAQDPANFAQLDFYLVKNEVAQYPVWNVFDQLYGKIDWITNQGNIMKGSTPQRSPVGRSFFFPNAVTTVANKDIYQVTESLEVASVYVHKYESFIFNFLPNFTAFWDTYLQFQNKDLVRQIANSNNQFIETNMFFNAAYVYLCGTGLTSGNPIAMGNATGNAANSKTWAWTVATINGNAGNGGVLQNLTLRDIYVMSMAGSEDLAIPPFMGVRNMPKDNDGMKEKYVLAISSEDWMNLTFDPDVQLLKPLNLDLLFNDFKGLLFGTTTCKILKYPVRFSTQNVYAGDGATVVYSPGQPIPPEIFDVTDSKWKPNPYYTSLQSANTAMGWFLGDSFGKSIKVGPPPKEFANKDMSAQKFYSMKWNGEIRLTDQFLLTLSDGSQELNDYGENLKFRSKLTHGWLVGERRNAFPIFIKRKRPVLLANA